MNTQCLVGLVVAALSSSALAQEAIPEFDAQNVRPSIDARRTLLTDDAGLAESNSVMGKVVFGQARDLLTFTLNRNGQEVAVIRDLTQMNLIVGYTISRFRVGLDTPVILSATSDLVDTQMGLGDIALDVRGTLLEPGNRSVGIALAARMGVPSATVDLPLGGAGLGYEISSIVDYRVGSLLSAVNLGYRGRPPAELDNIVLDDQVVVRTGVGYAITPSFGVSGDAVGYVQPSAPLDDVANGAWEGLAGLWTRFGDSWVVRGGAGSGLTAGIGTAKYRMLLSLGWEPEPVNDADSDGLMDRVDRCPDEAEDFDGFEDDDGCPDAKNPVRVLLRDPYGYPVDGAQVRLVHEDTGDEESGSARFTANLKPGIWIMTASAAGFDEFDEDFTVEEGESLDLVKVMEPVTPPPRVRVTRRAIRITEKVYFQTDSAIIMQTSHSILNAIASTMGQHPELLRIRIEGHTDSRGSGDYNLNLSQERADAVRRYLVQQGVEPNRLESAGRGETDPLDAREIPGAWDLNRRVEFVIDSRREETVQ